MSDLFVEQDVDEAIEDANLRVHLLLTSYIVICLFSVSLGFDGIVAGFPHFGNFFITLGLAALVFIAGEHTIRQHREGVALAPTGFTGRERAVFVAALAILVATAAL